MRPRAEERMRAVYKQRTRQIGTWMRNHRRALTFLVLSLASSFAALCLLLLSPAHRYDLRSVAYMLGSLTNMTFATGIWATRPWQPGGHEPPLPRLVAGWMLATLTLQGVAVWLTLCQAFDIKVYLLVSAFLFTGGGLLGVLITRAYQESRRIQAGVPPYASPESTDGA